MFHREQGLKGRNLESLGHEYNDHRTSEALVDEVEMVQDEDEKHDGWEGPHHDDTGQGAPTNQDSDSSMTEYHGYHEG